MTNRSNLIIGIIIVVIVLLGTVTCCVCISAGILTIQIPKAMTPIPPVITMPPQNGELDNPETPTATEEPLPDETAETLDALEAQFSPRFFRANRQFLLNRKVVKDASQYFGRKLLVNLTIPFKTPIIVSKLRTPAFTSWLKSC